MNTTINSHRIFAFFAATAFCSLVFIIRRPDLLANPQFWAEDGKFWLEQAYNLGPLKSLAIPQNGYYQTISKLVALASLAVPLYAAPLFFNLAAVLLRSLLIVFILSPRLDRYPLAGRLVLSLFILLMPHISEVHANVTNTHWYLAVWLFMVLISEPSKGIYWRIHDYLVMIVSGLSGPFIIFLAPVMVLRMLDGKIMANPVTLAKSFAKSITPFSATFFVVALIQVIAILKTGDNGRSHAPLGASLTTLCDILSAKIFSGFLLSPRAVQAIWEMHMVNITVTLACLILLTAIIIKGDWREKSIVIFPALVIGFSLARPMISLDAAQWPLMRVSGERYLLIPHIFWMAIILVTINRFSLPIKKVLACSAGAIVFATGIYNFGLPALPNSDWIGQAEKYDKAHPGEVVELQINPTGWSMHIKKPASGQSH